VYSYVVHVYCKGSSCDLFLEQGVHHGLECCWGIGESKEHYCWFEESLIRYKGCLVSVFLYYLHHIVPPADVDHCDQFGVAYSID